VFQEVIKQILKQKSHPYEVYNKGYKVIKAIFSQLCHQVIFRILHIFNLIQWGYH